MSINMRTHLSSVAEENKLSDGSGNIGVCENPQAGASVRAGKKPVCVKAALVIHLSRSSVIKWRSGGLSLLLLF